MAEKRRRASLDFLEAFCAADIERLRDLLTEDLRFEGPLLQTDSRRAYLTSLREDPPDRAEFRVREIAEGAESVGILWEYRTSGASVLISQWNRFRAASIAEIVLVFDARDLVEPRE